MLITTFVVHADNLFFVFLTEIEFSYLALLIMFISIAVHFHQQTHTKHHYIAFLLTKQVCVIFLFVVTGRFDQHLLFA